jgi:hypothetical protein
MSDDKGTRDETDHTGNTREMTMRVKCLEIRDANTFMPVICIKPVPENGPQRYLLRRDGYGGDIDERCVIVIKPQCKGCAYDPRGWGDRTMKVAHDYIEKHWFSLFDGDVIDVQFILGETTEKKISERLEPQF